VRESFGSFKTKYRIHSLQHRQCHHERRKLHAFRSRRRRREIVNYDCKTWVVYTHLYERGENEKTFSFPYNDNKDLIFIFITNLLK
jgi:hypothetical protein